MSSSCIPTGLRLDLDIVKAATSPGAHSSPLRPAHSSPSSTLSEASNTSSSSATSVSLKRARAPRKRPNQAYNEAAALLASIHPSVFPVKKSPKTASRPPTRQLSGLSAVFDPSSDLLPPLPVLADAAFLLRDTPPTPRQNCSSPAPVSSAFREFRDPAPLSPASPHTTDEPGELDFDDDCFLDVDEAAADGAAGGIDGIMGSLTVETNTAAATTSDDSILSSSGIHPYLRSLMVVGLAGRFELGLGSRHGARPNLNRALKRRDDDGAWWMWPAVPVKDITVAPPPPTPTPTPPRPQGTASNTTAAMPSPPSAPEKKKSKKKKVVKVEKVMAREKEEEESPPDARCKEEEAADGTVDAGNGDGAPTMAPKTGLGLKLDADDVLKAWSGKGSMFADGGAPESPKSAAEVRAKLADIDLFPENGNGAGGIREASVMRYKEKRRTRLFSKKIRYQVRKVNADCRPRMKGRFVRSPSLLQQVLEEES
ncbi:protein CHLOROPLAST IMPORT APPARATUS 2 [Oryza sativa Japonica Group]|uniref:protein CHLOROPLAST IMPORT APPARATUS 2 n=1 Tax=Oryza sativa subsp. japonica TaxID=39947 RepID=UPI0001B63CEC|nr:protein CHLOROPLAST IMPORT APPARATUS 2 [Oryza sativa Japonica Group]KAF2943057.1 hypothetical protein DAI22_02g038500 [Oryza sativa Japonica Group]